MAAVTRHGAWGHGTRRTGSFAGRVAAVFNPPAVTFTPGARANFVPGARETFTPGARANITPGVPQ